MNLRGFAIFRPHRGASSQQERQCSPIEDRDRGAALLEAVFAVALVGITAAALATVASALLAQARVASTNAMAREIALSVAEQETALGCGMLTGAEPDEVLRLAQERCGSLSPPAPVVLGDSDREIVRNGQRYQVILRYQWLPDPDLNIQDPPVPATCSNLAAGEPAAIAREVLVTPITTTGTTEAVSLGRDATGRTHQLWQVESVPPDAAAYASDQGALLINGVAPADAIDIRRVTDEGTIAGVAIRRYGREFTSGSAVTACVWFPYLAPGQYVVGRLNGTESGELEVEAGQATIIDYATLEPSP
jgi:hypothetical protein